MCLSYCFYCFFKQKTAYEMRISDWSSDVCSSDLAHGLERHVAGQGEEGERHQSQRLAFTGLRQLVAELPQDDQAAGDLDDRVQDEPDQRHGPDRKSSGEGKRVWVRVEHGGRRIMKKKKKQKKQKCKEKIIP